MSFIDSLIAKRIKNTNTSSEDDIFKFEKIKRAKREAEKNNPSVKLIDMGIGEPDKCADIEIINYKIYGRSVWSKEFKHR